MIAGADIGTGGCWAGSVPPRVIGFARARWPIVFASWWRRRSSPFLQPVRAGTRPGLQGGGDARHPASEAQLEFGAAFAKGNALQSAACSHRPMPNMRPRGGAGGDGGSLSGRQPAGAEPQWAWHSPHDPDARRRRTAVRDPSCSHRQSRQGDRRRLVENTQPAAIEVVWAIRSRAAAIANEVSRR